jgi:hypothetical protein
MTDNDGQFKLYGPIGDLIARGSMSALTERVLDSRARAHAISLLEDAAKAVGLLEAQQDHEQQLRQRQVRAFVDGVAAIGRRLDAVEQRHAERARQAAADEARAIQQQIDSWPDPDSADPFPHHSPGGELHALEPPNLGDKQQLAAARDQGDLPRELLKGAPPLTGNYPEPDPDKLAHPQDPPAQPVAISLNTED